MLEAIYDVFSQETDVSDRLELMKHGFSASVVAAQPVYAGGRNVNGNRLASLGEEAAVLQAEIRMRDVLEEVESTYYLVVGLKEKEATVEAATLKLNFEFQNSKLSTDSRPESRLLQINVESQELLKKMAVGETLPQLAILGIGYYGNAVRNDALANAVAGFSLKIPLSDWWNTSHKIREHNIRIEQARVEKEHYGNLMSIEEEKAYSDMVDACMLIRSDSAALRLARENYRLAEINYAAGVVTVSDVLQAHALLLQAENAVVDRQVSYLIARRRLSDLRIEK